MTAKKRQKFSELSKNLIARYIDIRDIMPPTQAKCEATENFRTNWVWRIGAIHCMELENVEKVRRLKVLGVCELTEHRPCKEQFWFIFSLKRHNLTTTK